MTRDKLIRQIGRYAGGEIDINELLTAVEAYSSASNNCKPLVSGALPLVEALEQYIKVLGEELDELVSMDATHGWKSSRVEIGEQMRNRITELKRQ